MYTVDNDDNTNLYCHFNDEQIPISLQFTQEFILQSHRTGTTLNYKYLTKLIPFCSYFHVLNSFIHSSCSFIFSFTQSLPHSFLFSFLNFLPFLFDLSFLLSFFLSSFFLSFFIYFFLSFFLSSFLYFFFYCLFFPCTMHRIFFFIHSYFFCTFFPLSFSHSLSLPCPRGIPRMAPQVWNISTARNHSDCVSRLTVHQIYSDHL